MTCCLLGYHSVQVVRYMRLTILQIDASAGIGLVVKTDLAGSASRTGSKFCYEHRTIHARGVQGVKHFQLL